MRSHRFDRRRGLVVAAITVVLAVLLLVAWGIYGLLVGPPAPQHPSVIDSTVDAVPPTSREGHLGPRPIADTADPEEFAHRVAKALFTWDTRSTADVSEWAQVVVDVADAEEAPATSSDVRSYLPTPAFWQQLRGYGTRQWLVIDSVIIPDAWSTAVQQAQPGQLPPGATAFTVSGTRHRVGVWGTEPANTSRLVAFTVFIACERPAPCRLLRLSQIDNPLR
jgi:hypothetical protein